MTQKAVYRIIDANFNRAREALRVMEEVCRFGLNHAGLTARSKQLRHDLCRAIAQLDSRQLLTCRDTPGDVGTDLCVDNPMPRTDLETCLTAGAKRLSEALRALAEVIQTLDPVLARTVEQIRYAAYTLEKDIVVLGEPIARFRRVRLYVLINGDDPARAMDLTERCIAGGADCLQLRCKRLNDRARLDLALRFTDRCRTGGVVSIINDRADIAVAARADGVHLGLEDLDASAVRRLQMEPLIIGLTTHNTEELDQAIAQTPTYVALGPAFATDTKPDLAPAGLDYLRQAMERLSKTDLAQVAIGGITRANLAEVLATGARTIAVCSAVTENQDPAQACRGFKEELSACKS